MADNFIYCPNCGSADIQEDEFGEFEDESVECVQCAWTGSSSMLVCEEGAE